MSLASWPSLLDPPMRAGFQRAAGEGRLLSRADTGPMRARRRFSAVVKPVALSLELSRAQLGCFDRFFDEDIAEGSLPFLMPDPITDGWPLLDDAGNQLLTDANLPILLTETWLCLVSDRLPAVSIVAGVTFRLDLGIAVLP